jgi:hypothetical protein
MPRSIVMNKIMKVQRWRGLGTISGRLQAYYEDLKVQATDAAQALLERAEILARVPTDESL